MTRAAGPALGVIIGFCLAALLVDASIGLLPGAPMFMCLLVVGFGLLAFAAASVVLLVSILSGPPADRRRAAWRVIVAAAVVVVTAVLVQTKVPVRIAFAASRGAFDDLASSLPPAAPTPQTNLDRRAGLYAVDAYAVDAAGGTYFRVGSSPSVIETTSFGFCIKPNPKTSPFGAARYELTDLGDGWFWFTANDDWY